MATSEFETTIRTMRPGGLLIWAGAGISIDSGIPLADEIRHGILHAVMGDEVPAGLNNIPLETLLADLRCAGLMSYRSIFAVDSPGMAHRFIARLFASGIVRTIVTTNFDPLIEVATEAERITGSSVQSFPFTVTARTSEFLELIDKQGLQGRLLVKPHGSIDDPDTIKDTVDGLAMMSMRRGIVPILDYVFVSGPHSHVLVLGYSGRDEFDVNPALYGVGESTKFVIRLQRQQATSQSTGMDPLRLEPTRPTFFGRATAVVRTDIREEIRNLSLLLGWADISESKTPIGRAEAPWRATQTNLTAELARDDGLRRKLADAALHESLLNMLTVNGASGGDQNEATRLVQRIVRKCTSAARAARASGAKELEMAAQSMLAKYEISPFILQEDPGLEFSRNEVVYDFAMKHALQAMTISKLLGQDRVAQAMHSLRCAQITEHQTGQADSAIPEYRRIYALAREQGSGENVSLAAYSLARSLCAKAAAGWKMEQLSNVPEVRREQLRILRGLELEGLSEGAMILESELATIEQHSNSAVLLAAYNALSECEFRIGQVSKGREYAAKAISLQVADGLSREEDRKAEMIKRESGTPRWPYFNLSLPPKRWSV